MFDAELSPAIRHPRHAAAPPRLAGLGLAVPERRWAQREVYAYLAERAPLYRRKDIKALFENAGIGHRHFALTPEEFDPAPSPDAQHAGFKEAAIALTRKAALAALAHAGLAPEAIDLFVVATSTGYLCPGLAARTAPLLGLKPSVPRTEIVGAGCAGALPALRAGHDFLHARPNARALVVCVEVCSACAYVDEDLETAVGMAICADGAAAAVLEGATLAEGPSALPRMTAFETAADSSYLDTVGFAHRQGNLRIILNRKIPTIAAGPAQAAAGAALAREGLSLGDVSHWVVHSGGRKVLDELSARLGLPPAALAASRAVLAQKGNMSSPTVLFVLAETLRARRPQPGEAGVLIALGPGLVAEACVLRW